MFFKNGALIRLANNVVIPTCVVAIFSGLQSQYSLKVDGEIRTKPPDCNVLGRSTISNS